MLSQQSKVRTVKLNDGNEIPIMAFGTGTSQAFGDSSISVKSALQSGFTHLDCAWWYKNQKYTSRGIRESGISRSGVYITSKAGDFHADPAEFDVEVFLNQTLEDMDTDYVDLYLLHADILMPSEIMRAWRQMERVKKSGKARSIGVSNFSTKSLQTILDSCEIVPAVNQIEFHPYSLSHYLPTLIPLCKKHNIKIEGYAPLLPLVRHKQGPVDMVLEDIREERGKVESVGQILLIWAQQVSEGVVITTTSKPDRMVEQLQPFIFDTPIPRLCAEHVDRIARAGAEAPYRHWGTIWPYFMQGEGGIQGCPIGSTHKIKLDNPTAHLR